MDEGRWRRSWFWQLGVNVFLLVLLAGWLFWQRLAFYWWPVFLVLSLLALIFLWTDLTLARSEFSLPINNSSWQQLVVWLRRNDARAIFHHFWGQLTFMVLVFFLWTSGNSLAGFVFLFFLATDLLLELLFLGKLPIYRQIWQRQLRASFSGYNFARGVAIFAWLLLLLKLITW